ncbi:MAG: phage holin family protein [Candidatus Binatia bacterium]
MADEVSETGAVREPGIFDSLRTLVTDLTALLHTRIELASTELEEEMERLKRMLVLAAISLFCFSVGLILLNIFIVVVFWDSHRLLALGGLTALYLIAGLIVGLVMRRQATASQKLLSATISEFAKDRERLRSCM